MKDEIDRLTKQKQYLQFQCRKAGDTIKGYQMLVKEQKKDIWELKKIHSKNESNKNLLQGYRKVIVDLSNKLRRQDS